jgi:hypothetical protein
MRILFLSLVICLTACTKEQSESIGQQPKKTIDRVTSDVGRAMQQGQGSERLNENPQRQEEESK